MWKSVLVGTMALAVAGSSVLYAQQVAAPAVEHDHWRPSAADLNAFTDARIAALKVGLQLTPDQEKSWPAVEQALRDMAKARQDRMARRQDQHSVDLIARLRTRADLMTQRAAELKKLADASQPLFETLSEEQKHRLVFLVRALRPHHQHFGSREHHDSMQP